MEHQEIYEWLKELAFKNCDKENREQIFWFFEDILEDEIKVEKQEDEIERLNNIISKAKVDINNMKEIIRKQPSEDEDTDAWIQVRLSGLLYIIEGSE